MLLGIIGCISGLICYRGPLFGFTSFLVMRGGILIVFAYTISLVSFDKEESGKEGEYINLKENWANWKGLKFVNYGVLYGHDILSSKKLSLFRFFLWGFLSLFGWVYLDVDDRVLNVTYRFSEIGYFTMD